MVSTLCAIIFGYIAFIRNRDKDKSDELKEFEAQKAVTAKADATILTEIGYIKSNTDEIKAEQKEQRKTNLEVLTRLTAVEASAKQAHKRIDTMEGRQYYEKAVESLKKVNHMFAKLTVDWCVIWGTASAFTRYGSSRGRAYDAPACGRDPCISGSEQGFVYAYYSIRKIHGR